jgi:hypothetical protein
MNRAKLTLMAAGFSLAITFTFGCGGSKSQSTVVSNEKSAVEKGLEVADELQTICDAMMAKEIPCAIGIGKSSDQMTARNMASDEARINIATAMQTRVARLVEPYRETDSSSDTKKIFIEKTNMLTVENVRGAVIYKTQTVYNEKTKHYESYNLLVVNPAVLKQMLSAAALGNEDMELMVKSAEMQKRLDAAVSEYEAKYKR